MNATRSEIKKQNRQLHKALEAAEQRAKRRREKRLLQGKQSEVLFGLGNLVFGGAIIGGIFQETQVPLSLYITGFIAFAILMWWGFYLYKKSINEE